ncbi:MAG: prolyl oligopeptidase family serine peptidase [Anaerolineales bacterium]|nr:prolyl oligopeptidase family serine peptidase [Anaerolineales bacterium]
MFRLWINDCQVRIASKLRLRWRLTCKLFLMGLGGWIGGIVFLTIVQAAPPTQPYAQAGSWVYTSVTYQGETHAVNVYRPSGYPNDAPYPVVYLLHGWGGTPTVWPNEYPILAEQADTYGVLIVAVEGDNSNIPPSWYSPRAQIPWPDGEFWRISFYDWFFRGVLPWVAANYAIRTDPGGRAIAGFSMGGKGAMSLAGHRPDLFVAAAEWGGVMDLRDYSTNFDIQYVYGPIASQTLSYAADSPIELAANLKGLSITLLHGAEDTYVHYQQSRTMRDKLSTLGYTYLWEEIPNLAHVVNNYEITRTLQRFDAAFLVNGVHIPPEVGEAFGAFAVGKDFVNHLPFDFEEVGD